MRMMIALTALVLAFPVQAEPEYASDETREVIENMVEAHGGLKRWQNVPSIRYYNVMHDNYAGKSGFAWWIAYEVIDQKTRQVWQHWPMDDADIGYDGEQVWSVGWKRGNPPSSQVYMFYHFLNLPWLTQDEGVQLGELGAFEWPGTGKTLHEIRMTFAEAPGVGRSGKDYYVLYIDPDSFRLVGYQYAVGYRPLLDVMGQPKDREIFGPLWRVITRYEEVDGLLFPSAFRTMPEADERIVGNHVILDIEVDKPFEHQKSSAPEGADIFTGPMTTP